MNTITSMDDLHWKASHEIGDVSLSIIQGDGCQGKRNSDTFEVLAWDSKGNIPLSDYEVASYFSTKDVLKLINCISNWEDKTTSWATYQREFYPKLIY